MAPQFATFVCCFLLCAGLAYGNYCSGYDDIYGSYVPGFNCPTSSDIYDEMYCCSDTTDYIVTNKYCCDYNDYYGDTHITTWNTGYTVVIVFGVISVIAGIFSVVLRLIVIRRRSQLAHAHTTIVTGTTCGVENPVYPSCGPPPAYPGPGDHLNAEPTKSYGIN